MIIFSLNMIFVLWLLNSSSTARSFGPKFCVDVVTSDPWRFTITSLSKPRAHMM